MTDRWPPVYDQEELDGTIHDLHQDSKATGHRSGSAMVHVGFDIDEGILARFHQAPDAFAREMRIAAAVKWYEREQVS